MATAALLPPTSTRTWSRQQEAVFSWFERPTGFNLIVRARAGTGKTTTIIEGVNRAPDARILLCAFSAAIAEELTLRITSPRAKAKTLHSLGAGIVHRNWEGLKVDKTGARATSLTEAVCGGACPDPIKRLVSQLHTKGREITPYARTGADLLDLAVTFELEPDDSWRAEGYSTEYVCEMAAKAMELAAKVKPVVTGIDFSDMIFLPVRNRWLRPMFDCVVVDEGQDMNFTQIEIARGVARDRICVVGDDKQGIFAFRGADTSSLDRLKHELDAQELGLTTTYRCGRRIVALAQALVPDFTAGPANPEGLVRTLPHAKLVAEAALGDFILSRLNAPLVSTAMSLLRAGKRTKIKGKDVGGGLKALVRRLAKGKAANSMPAFLERLAAWEEKQATRALAAGRPDKADNIHDQAAMLVSLQENATSVSDLEDRIEALFTDNGLGHAGVITCSSIHRAKGLEANRVFVLTKRLSEATDEERNIKYVAITRAKHELVWVNNE